MKRIIEKVIENTWEGAFEYSAFYLNIKKSHKILHGRFYKDKFYFSIQVAGKEDKTYQRCFQFLQNDESLFKQGENTNFSMKYILTVSNGNKVLHLYERIKLNKS